MQYPGKNKNTLNAAHVPIVPTCTIQSITFPRVVFGRTTSSFPGLPNGHTFAWVAIAKDQRFRDLALAEGTGGEKAGHKYAGILKGVVKMLSNDKIHWSCIAVLFVIIRVLIQHWTGLDPLNFRSKSQKSNLWPRTLNGARGLFEQIPIHTIWIDMNCNESNNPLQYFNCLQQCLLQTWHPYDTTSTTI